MGTSSRSLRAVVFAVLGVALPFLAAEQLRFGRASSEPKEGEWGICLAAAIVTHIILVATVIFRWRQIAGVLRGSRGKSLRIMCLASVMSTIC